MSPASRGRAPRGGRPSSSDAGTAAPKGSASSGGSPESRTGGERTSDRTEGDVGAGLERGGAAAAQTRPAAVADASEPEAKGAGGAITAREPTTARPPTAQPRENRDVVLVHSACEDGDGYHVLRQRGEQLEVGQIRSLREGQPIVGEVVKLSPRPESERLFDVDVVLDRKTARPHKGPARVATDSYRRNWELIFGSRAAKRAGGEAPN